MDDYDNLLSTRQREVVVTFDWRLAWIWAQLFRWASWWRENGGGVQLHPLCMCERVRSDMCKEQPVLCHLLNSSISWGRFLQIKHRNGLTSSLPSCHVNSADGGEIKGPSRQPFFHTLPILGDKLILINLIKDMWEAQPYVEEISVECRPFSRLSPSLLITAVSVTHTPTCTQSISALFSLKGRQ